MQEKAESPVVGVSEDEQRARGQSATDWGAERVEGKKIRQLYCFVPKVNEHEVCPTRG